MLSGQWVLLDGERTDALPGRVLRAEGR
jgi:hypothetical protein